MPEVQNQKPRLWVVTELYYPEETSTGYYLTRIAEGLTDVFSVRVICGQPNYSARGTKAPAREIHREVEIYRVAGTTLDKNKIPFRLINMLSLSVSTFFRALLNFQKNDAVLVVTTPPLLPFIAALAAKIRRAEYTLLIHDNYPEILIAAGKTTAESPFSKIMNRANRLLYRHAEKIVVVGRDMRELIEFKIADSNKKPNTPVVFISNWAELEQVSPEPRRANRLLEELNIEEKLVFLYAGNMGYPNDLESIVRCAEKLRGDERFHFIFLGAGVKRRWLEREISEKRLKNVSLLDPRPRGEQKTFLNACDVALVSLIKKMRGVSMPSRTYNILAAGKPILALTEENSELDLLVREERVGWRVPPNAPETLLKEIYRIYDERAELEEMGRRARTAAVEKYSLQTAVAAYKKELSKKNPQTATRGL